MNKYNWIILYVFFLVEVNVSECVHVDAAADADVNSQADCIFHFVFIFRFHFERINFKKQKHTGWLADGLAGEPSNQPIKQVSKQVSHPTVKGKLQTPALLALIAISNCIQFEHTHSKTQNQNPKFKNEHFFTSPNGSEKEF